MDYSFGIFMGYGTVLCVLLVLALCVGEVIKAILSVMLAQDDKNCINLHLKNPVAKLLSLCAPRYFSNVTNKDGYYRFFKNDLDGVCFGACYDYNSSYEDAKRSPEYRYMCFPSLVYFLVGIFGLSFAMDVIAYGILNFFNITCCIGLVAVIVFGVRTLSKLVYKNIRKD